MRLRVLSAGAAERLVGVLAPQFKAATRAEIDATYGAVGSIKGKLLAGAPADLLILTSALIAELTQTGHVRAGSAADIGRVETSIAVRSGEPPPQIGNEAALRAALLAADAIYFPDPEVATAGIHFTRALEKLGVRDTLSGRLRTFPNGSTAMRAMAANDGHPIGCTQATEILATAGVTLVGPLPDPFGLATVYTCGVAAASAEPDLAARMAALLTSPATAEVRRQLGFGAVE